MRTTIVEKHQVAGLDERERGFNRLLEIGRVEGGYRASLQYEKTVVTTDRCETQAVAVDSLIGLLHRRGYTRLRSRRSFQGSTYLGSQENWIEYPDPERSTDQDRGLRGWLDRLRQTLGV